MHAGDSILFPLGNMLKYSGPASLELWCWRCHTPNGVLNANQKLNSLQSGAFVGPFFFFSLCSLRFFSLVYVALDNMPRSIKFGVAMRGFP